MTQKLNIQAFVTTLRQNPNFNVSSFTQLIEDTSEDVALKMLARFHQTLNDCLSSITTGLKTENRETLWKATHKIAGTAELLGFKNFGIKSKELTQTLRAPTETASAEKMSEELLTSLRQYLNEGRKIDGEILKGCPNLSAYL